MLLEPLEPCRWLSHDDVSLLARVAQLPHIYMCKHACTHWAWSLEVMPQACITSGSISPNSFRCLWTNQQIHHTYDKIQTTLSHHRHTCTCPLVVHVQTSPKFLQYFQWSRRTFKCVDHQSNFCTCQQNPRITWHLLHLSLLVALKLTYLPKHLHPSESLHDAKRSLLNNNCPRNKTYTSKSYCYPRFHYSRDHNGRMTW